MAEERTMLVSVITPSLNGERYLRNCISSVQDQRGPTVDVEHIMVDGGSTDGTPELASAQGCIVITRSERNVYAAINKGIRHASGDLIGILGCDDALLPGALAKVVQKYRAEGLPWLLGAMRWLDADGRTRGDQPSPPRWMTVEMLGSIHWSPFPSLSAYLEPDFLSNIGYFDVSYEYAADYDLFLRARLQSTYSRINTAISAQHRHGGNLSMQRTETHAQEISKINAQYGPPSRARLRLNALATRLAVNAMSPRWYLSKQVDKIKH